MFYSFSSDQHSKFKHISNMLPDSKYFYAKSPCPKCGNEVNSNKIPPDNFTVKISKSGKQFPDCICFGPASFFKIISGKALECFQSNGITGFIPHRIYKIYDHKMEDVELPYYFLEVTGTINIDYSASRLNVISHCDFCGFTEYDSESRNRFNSARHELYVDYKSWSGEDLFKVNYCTIKVLKAVYDNKLTGFNFTDPVKRFITDKNGTVLDTNDIDLKKMFGNPLKNK